MHYLKERQPGNIENVAVVVDVIANVKENDEKEKKK